MKKVNLLILLISLGLSQAHAELSNRCYVSADKNLQLYIMIGLDRGRSVPIVGPMPEINEAIDQLRLLQTSGTCPKKSDRNPDTCLVYPAETGGWLIAIGDGIEGNGDVFKDIDLQEPLNIAHRLMELGQCSRILIKSLDLE